MSIELNDHDVTIYGEHLKGKRIAVIITGGIAAYTAPSILRALRKYSCEVFPYATRNALKFVTEDVLSWAANHKVVTDLTDRSEHLGQDNLSFDAVVVYPATYNFIGKMSCGIADDACSTLIASHLSKSQIIYCPAMHRNMFESQIFRHNVAALRTVGHAEYIHPFMTSDKANVQDTVTTVSNIVRLLSTSYLKGERILVTAGPTPVKIDNVRRITNKFSGKLGIEIANELFLRGADVRLLQSYGGIRPPKHIPHALFEDYEEYKRLCLEECKGAVYGIFSAAVADYMPKQFTPGKIPSGGALKEIELIPTEKVIDLCKAENPNMNLISFKYQEGKTLPQLLKIADKRLKAGHRMVIANDLKLNKEKQVCFLVDRLDKKSPGFVKAQAEGKINIARMICDEIGRDYAWTGVRGI